MGGGFMSPSSFGLTEDFSEGLCIDDEGDDEALNQGFLGAIGAVNLPGQKGSDDNVMGGGFMSPSSSEELSEGPMCIDDEGDNETLNQGFAKAMQGQGSGNESKHLPGQKGTDDNDNTLLDDKSKTNLAINSERYRADRSMRLAVLEASKTLEEEQQRRAREEMRQEQAKSMRSAGLIYRRGGEMSADAIRQLVVQQQKEEQKKVQKARKRGGRRHDRTKTESDIRGMFGGPDSENSGGTLSSSQRCSRGRLDHLNNGPSLLRQSLPPVPSPDASDLPDLPKVRDATKPGQFRKTNYDPFSFGVSK